MVHLLLLKVSLLESSKVAPNAEALRGRRVRHKGKQTKEQHTPLGKTEEFLVASHGERLEEGTQLQLGE